MACLIHTVGGTDNLVSFQSAARVPIESLKIHFKPTQDLHGYSKPWAGGGGKNLFDAETSLPKKYVGSNGTIIFSDDWSASDFIPVTAGQTYTISGADAPGGTGCHAFYDENKEFVSSVTGFDHLTFTVPEGATYVRFSVRTETPTNVQLEKGSAATAWEPYENVCPIEGWTGVEVYHDDVWLPPEYQRVEWIESDGNQYLISEYIPTIGDEIEINTLIYSHSEYTRPLFAGDGSFRFGFVDTTAGLYFTYFTEGGAHRTQVISTMQWHNLRLNSNGEIYIDGVFASKDTRSRSGLNGTDNRVYLFQNKLNEGAATSRTRIGEVKISRDKAEKMHLIPCYCKSDNRPGMYDAVSGEFFVNQGTGEFICGPDVGTKLQITFPPSGKNKFDKDNIPTTEGNITATGTIGHTSGFCYTDSFYLPKGNYTYSAHVENTSYSEVFVRIHEYDSNGQWVKQLGAQEKTLNEDYSIQFEVTSEMGYIRLSKPIGLTNEQIEFGADATTYEPYSLDNTVYGGYLDVITGELYATEYLFKIDETSPLRSFGVGQNVGRAEYLLPYIGANKNALLTNSVSKRSRNSAAWNYPTRGRLSLEPDDSNTTAVIIGSPARKTTRDAWIDWLTNHSPIEVLYELKEPLLVGKVSPIKINTLLGPNNIWSNTGSQTELGYSIHDSAPIRAAKKRIAAENDKHYRKVLWNQMAGPMTSQYWKRYNTNVTALEFIDDYAEITINQTTDYHYPTSIYTSNEPSVDINHYYYASYLVCPNFSGGKFSMEFAGGQNSDYFNTTVDEWKRVSGYSKGRRTGSGRIYIPNFVKDTYSIGDKAKVKNAIYIDLTAMFGIGNEPTKEEFEKICAMNNIDLASYYPIDSGTEQVWCIPDTTNDKYITVNYNQYCSTLISDNWKPYNSDKVSIEFDNYIMTTTIIDSASNYNTAIVSHHNWIKDHKYYIKEEFNPSKNAAFAIVCNNDWAATKACPANIWTIIQCIATNSSNSSGKIWLAYYAGAASVGDTCQIRNPIVIDLTQMFGAGNEPATIAELRETCLKNNINLDAAQPYTIGSTIIWKK